MAPLRNEGESHEIHSHDIISTHGYRKYLFQEIEIGFQDPGYKFCIFHTQKMQDFLFTGINVSTQRNSTI